ncbi:MAG: type Z 30S ribosomal protein S14 [Planctomycetes bacterium]|nr:type Z 30S ribosomal protein S14 [Planctomycetota bacterium]
MARTSLKVKAKRPAKFSTRAYNRCDLCGRSAAYYRKFRMCRICLRDLALKGLIPGMKKASW